MKGMKNMKLRRRLAMWLAVLLLFTAAGCQSQTTGTLPETTPIVLENLAWGMTLAQAEEALPAGTEQSVQEMSRMVTLKVTGLEQTVLGCELLDEGSGAVVHLQFVQPLSCGGEDFEPLLEGVSLRLKTEDFQKMYQVLVKNYGDPTTALAKGGGPLQRRVGLVGPQAAAQSCMWFPAKGIEEYPADVQCMAAALHLLYLGSYSGPTGSLSAVEDLGALDLTATAAVQQAAAYSLLCNGYILLCDYSDQGFAALEYHAGLPVLAPLAQDILG